jgi:hypothetical protein
MPHIHGGICHPLTIHPSFPDHAEHQLRIETFPSPRRHSLVIEVGGDLAAIQPILLKPKNAVDEGLMGRVKIDQGQRLGLDRNPKTEAVFRRPLKFIKGKSEIIPP